jgi:ABC-type dipeptide/oligopeptide/nickel transport system permease subunit
LRCRSPAGISIDACRATAFAFCLVSSAFQFACVDAEAMFVFVSRLAFNLLGDGLRDAVFTDASRSMNEERS